MAVGENTFPDMAAVDGIRLATANAGVKQTLRDDVLLIEMAEGGSCAAVFTRNAFCAAPVQCAKAHLQQAPRWLLVNSGNANAGTGKQGLQDAYACCLALANEVAGLAEQVLPFSTGVIGEPLPVEKICRVLPKVAADLNGDAWPEAARAIMTTDTFPKGVTRTLEVDGEAITINGIAKGAGMIQPNMATMLAFIATNAAVEAELLQQCLAEAVAQSFNLITVDGDTSTNDACVVLASATSSANLAAGSAGLDLFSAALRDVCRQLAELIVRDGEGATKLIRIRVEQARDSGEAEQVAKTIAHSPLVKTAFFASDPNWGRILAAVGRAGVADLAIDRIQIYLGTVCIVENGGRAAAYSEQDGQRVMAQSEILVTVRLGRGQAANEVLTCDFSYDYVRINAEYRS